MQLPVLRLDVGYRIHSDISPKQYRVGKGSRIIQRNYPSFKGTNNDRKYEIIPEAIRSSSVEIFNAIRDNKYI